MPEKSSKSVSEFILSEVQIHPSDLVSVVAGRFGFSRQRAHRYVEREVKRGAIIKVGRTRQTRYFLSTGKEIRLPLKIDASLQEDVVWSKYVKPLLAHLPENIRTISYYGFTEILNNAIDHSGGTEVYIEVKFQDNNLVILIMDNGIGIFRKIREALKLDTTREAILHLSKGKFTTEPSTHTGEGIFFTSRVFDRFSISSEEMFYTFTGNDWLLSPEKHEDFGHGTSIIMEIRTDSDRQLKEVMDHFANSEIGFAKTIVAVALSADPNDPHISRSQAKRLLLGLEKFRTVVLDFRGVSAVGQAFVDEVFRVFRNEHPNVHITYVNASPEVEKMIKRGQVTI